MTKKIAISKLLVIIFTAFQIRAQEAAGPAEQKFKIDSPVANTVEACSNQDQVDENPLELVSQIKPIRAIIAGYLGHTDFREVADKKIIASKIKLDSHQKQHSAKITLEYGSEAWNELSEYVFGKRAGATRKEAISPDRNWRTRISKTRSDAQCKIMLYSDPSGRGGPAWLLHKEITAQQQIGQLTISPDSLFLMSHGFNVCEDVTKALIYNLKTADLVHTLEYGMHEVKPRFSPDGKYIAFAESREKIIIIDARDYRFIAAIDCPRIGDFEFSLDGRYIVTASESDKTLRFYEKTAYPAWLAK